MKCPNCKYVIKDNNLICLKCGFDLQGYYDDAMNQSAQKKEPSVDDRYATRPMPSGGARERLNQRKYASTRILNQEDRRRIRLAEEERRRAFVEVERVLEREEQARIYYRNDNSRSDYHESNYHRNGDYENEQHSGEAKVVGRKARGKQVLITLLVALVILVGAGFIIHHNSYQGIVSRGNQALGGGQLMEAELLFRRAIERSPHRYEGIVGLARVYQRNNQLGEAEEILLTALVGQATNLPLYEAIIEFYIETEQYVKISQLLDGADPRVLDFFEEYVSFSPVFSLEEGLFEEVQEVTIFSEMEGVIHYTIDGREPTTASPIFREPLLLNAGEHTIRAILVNPRGIPSLTATRNYAIQLPITDAPAVTPSTGLYHEPTQIIIHVPPGYTAFFTIDGSIPTMASHRYEEPIDMAVGNTIFTAILVNNISGRVTDATVRNFTLELDEIGDTGD